MQSDNRTTIDKRWEGHVPAIVDVLDLMGGKDGWYDAHAIQRLSGRSRKNVMGQLERAVRDGYVEEHMAKYRIPVEGVDGATLPGYVREPEPNLEPAESDQWDGDNLYQRLDTEIWPEDYSQAGAR